MNARDRMPLIPLEAMTADQKKAYDQIVSGPRKALFGPFIPLLRSPDLMTRVQKLGEYLRFDSALPKPIREMVALIVARQWTQQFEWNVHRPLGEKEGLEPALIAALAEGRRPEQMSKEEESVYDFASELHENHSVSDRSYSRVVEHFGDQGAVELTTFIGYYTMLAMVMNAARTDPGPSEGPALVHFPS